MGRLLLAFGVGLTVVLAPGCDDLVGPDDDFELPPADMSLDPDRLAPGGFLATPCALGSQGNGLAHLRDRDGWALVDVFFSSDPTRGPTLRDVRLVASHGGRVLHHFNVPAVRARIVLSRIPDLLREGSWIIVRDVPDPTRYDLGLSVGFTRPVQDPDLDLVASLGGRVDRRHSSGAGLWIVLPDRMVPQLRDGSDVSYVEVRGIACAA